MNRFWKKSINHQFSIRNVHDIWDKRLYHFSIYVLTILHDHHIQNTHIHKYPFSSAFIFPHSTQLHLTFSISKRVGFIVVFFTSEYSYKWKKCCLFFFSATYSVLKKKQVGERLTKWRKTHGHYQISRLCDWVVGDD